MAKKRTNSLAGRAWSLLRLAFIWARKGSAFKRGLMLDLQAVVKGLRTDGSGSGGDSDSYRIHYLEREFSFDETPAFNFKMHRPTSTRFPRIPCITPSVVDFDNDDDWIFFKGEKESDLFCHNYEKYEKPDKSELEHEAEVEMEEEKEIDTKAEEFIAQFYEQMKLQRQVSALKYNEMLRRGAE